MPAQYWVSTLRPGYTADGAAYGTATALTAISPTPDTVLGANFLAPGSQIHVVGAGRYSTTATPTVIFGLYYGGIGGTLLAASAAITTGSGVTNLTWRFEADVVVRTDGSSGTAMTTGVVYGVAATAVALVPVSAPVTATIDTTASKSIVLAATWGTNNAANTLTCHFWQVQSVGM